MAIKIEDITDLLTEKGIAEIKVGQYLKFDKAEMVVNSKVNGRVFARVTATTRADDQDKHVMHIKQVIDNKKRCAFCTKIIATHSLRGVDKSKRKG